MKKIFSFLLLITLFFCSGCKIFLTECEENGHDLIHHEGKAPTCMQPGFEPYDTCSRCDYTTFKEIPAVDHKSTGWIIDKQPTASSYGSRHKECIFCGTILEREDIPMLEEDVIYRPLRMKPKKTYETVQSEQKLFDSFKDSRYYYYFYDVGRIDNVPVQRPSESINCFFNGMNYDFNLSVNDVKTSSIENIVKQVMSNVNTWENAWNTGNKIEIANQIYRKIPNSNRFNQLNGGFERKIDNVSREGTHKSILNGAEYGREVKQTLNVKFDSTFSHGSYRFVVGASISCYAVLILDPIEHVFTVDEYYTVGPYSWFLDYSSNALFDDYKYEPLKFDINKINQIVEPESYYSYEDILNEDAIKKGFDSGKGTKENPYILKGNKKPALEQLLSISKYPEASFKLETDIDFKDYKFDTVSAVIKGCFKGNLDGNNHTIKNLNINSNYQICRPSTIPYGNYKYLIALFERVDGNIYNLNIDGFDLYFDYYHDGDVKYVFASLAGVLDSHGSLSNINLNNSRFHVHRDDSLCAGLVGINKGVIRNCSVYNCNFKGNGVIGGICSHNFGSIYNCINDGSTFYYWFVNNSLGMGGIAGYQAFEDSKNDVIIERCIVNNTKFIAHHNDSYGFFGSKHYNPKHGYIVGHAGGGKIYEVSSSGCTNHLEDGVAGDYYFKIGWGWAGRNDNCDVK